jgi:hypothetical protein
MKLTKQDQYEILRDQAIEASYFITKAVVRGDYDLAETFNTFLSDAIENLKKLNYASTQTVS